MNFPTHNSPKDDLVAKCPSGKEHRIECENGVWFCAVPGCINFVIAIPTERTGPLPVQGFPELPDRDQRVA
jgi:hypothetical protein